MSAAIATLTVEKARAMLESCRDLGEIKRLGDTADTLAAYGRAQRAAFASICDAEEIAIRARRRAGEIMLAMEKAKVVGPAAKKRNTNSKVEKSCADVEGPSKMEACAAAGFDHNAVHRCQKLARYSDEELEEAVARRRGGADPKLSLEGQLLRPHQVHNSGNDEWYTPPEYIEAARDVMGSIDLDPATCELANKTVLASRAYTKDDNGLAKEWHGNVWMNPPYSQPLVSHFVDKLVSERLSDRISSAITITVNNTETKWGQALLGVADAVCFTNKRVKFRDINGQELASSPLQGHMLCYLGPDSAKFCEKFSKFGVCKVRHA